MPDSKFGNLKFCTLINQNAVVFKRHGIKNPIVYIAVINIFYEISTT